MEAICCSEMQAFTGLHTVLSRTTALFIFYFGDIRENNQCYRYNTEQFWSNFDLLISMDIALAVYICVLRGILSDLNPKGTEKLCSLRQNMRKSSNEWIKQIICISFQTNFTLQRKTLAKMFIKINTPNQAANNSRKKLTNSNIELLNVIASGIYNCRFQEGLWQCFLNHCDDLHNPVH
jgi:hypothetical protein